VRNVTTASKTVERTVEDGQAPREVASVEVNGINLIFHHVNAVTKWTAKQREVLVTAVVAAATVYLVVIQLFFWNEIAHDVRMTPKYGGIERILWILLSASAACKAGLFKLLLIMNHPYIVKIMPYHR